MTKQISLIGYEWNVCEYHGRAWYSLPCSGVTYMLTVRKTRSRWREIVYVGVTENLRGRIKTHLVPKPLRKSLDDSYKVEILYKCFGKYYDNWEKELNFIHTYQPAFNKVGTKNNRYEIDSFYERINKRKTA